MRVLFVNENIGGHATVHHNLRLTLGDHRDLEADFIDIPERGWLRRIFGASIPVLGRFDLDLQPLRDQLATSMWAHRRIRPLVDDYDVVHLYTQNAGLLSSRTLRRAASVVTLDTTTTLNAYRLPHRQPTRFTKLTVAASRPFEKMVFAAADIVVANSVWAANSLRSYYGLSDAKVRVMPFGIVSPQFETPVAPGTSASGLPRIVFVGRQMERKGGTRLLRLHQQHLVDRARLVLVTQDPVPAGENVDVINDLTPGDDRLWEILRSAAIFAFPSPIDQAPNAVLEAMAAGLPVVAIDTAAVSEMVADGSSGLLVAPDASDEDLLSALTRLVDDEDLRAKFGEEAQRRYCATYDAHHSTAELVSILREAASLRHEMSTP